MFTGVPIPCKIHFQRADQTGLHGLYVPPNSLWSPSRKLRNETPTRRRFSWARRSSWHAKSTTRGTDLEQESSATGDSGISQQLRRSFLRLRNNSMQTSISDIQSMTVTNTVICIIQGSSIVWELKDGVYPIYVQVSPKSSRAQNWRSRSSLYWC